MKRRVVTCLSLGLAASFALALLSALSDAREVTQNVLRLHVEAHSDDAKDQRIKLKVRDAVLEASGELFASAKNRDEAIAIAREHKGVILRAADKAVRDAGSDDKVSFSLGERYFPTRIYNGGLRLPAGSYSAVTLSVGSGGGNNWWCMMYPALCVSGSLKEEPAKKLDDVLSDGGLALIRYPAPAGVEIKFKLVEWFENLRHRIRGEK